MHVQVKTQLTFISFTLIVRISSAVFLSCSNSSELSDNVVDFVSPSFPDFLDEDLTCEVSVRLRTTYNALRIDFVNVTMHGQAPFGNLNRLGSCETDMIFFMGLDHWTTTAKCGELTGYSFLYDRRHKKLQDGTFKIVALMSSRKYRWHIRIRQYQNPSNRRRSRRSKKADSTGNNTESSRITPIQRIIGNYSRSQTRRLKDPVVKYISNGTSLINATVPWLVSIRKKNPSKHITVSNCPDAATEGLHLCGGTIISPDFIVTAAHCLYGRSKYLPFDKLEDLKVVVGETNVCKDNRRDYDYPSFDYDVQSVVFYYGFDHDSPYKDHDIAVIKLKRSILFMHHIQPVELNEDIDRTDARIGLISGFGKWNDKDKGYSVQTNSTTFNKEYFPFNPQYSLVNIVPEFNCSFNSFLYFIRFEFFIGPYISHFKYNDSIFRKLCHVSFVNNTEIGRGKPEGTDSGGPVISLSGPNNTPHLWGIILSTRTRFIYENAQFYTFLSVARYKPWINAVMYSF